MNLLRSWLPAASPSPMAPAADAGAPIQLCFGSVRHQRLRPAPNRFSYRVFFLRLPLRTLARNAAGASVATAIRNTAGNSWLFSRNRFNLLAFHDRDHGDGRQPLTAWIDALLTAQGIHDADGEIWLQAFPRVLGYVFNPVSFWFCHQADGALRAVVCEVRNTFGEKHYYLLDTGAAMPYGIELAARKIFHVSPFCTTTGGYRFRFMRVLAAHGTPERTVARIDHDDHDGPLLLTSINGSAVTLSDRHALRAFFGYPLLTLGVVLRIHWQALQLWRKRVPFIRKPAAPTQEISR